MYSFILMEIPSHTDKGSGWRSQSEWKENSTASCSQIAQSVHVACWNSQNSTFFSRWAQCGFCWVYRFRFRIWVKVPFSCLEGFVVQFGFQFFVVRNLAHSLHEILLYHVVTLSTYSKHTCNTHKARLVLWTANQSVWFTNVHTMKPWTELFFNAQLANKPGKGKSIHWNHSFK